MNSKKWRFVILGISLAALIGFSISIYLRTSNELLWGYRPLGLFFFGWIVLVSIFFRHDFGTLKWDHPLSWATLSGVLLGFSFPGDINIPFLSWIAFLPLLRAEELIFEAKKNKSSWQVFRCSYHTLILWNILSTYWVANASLGAGIFAITVNSALMAGIFTLFHSTRKILPKFRFLPLVAFWIMFEYLHYRWDLSWPWLTLGNIWANAPMAVQWYAYTGVLGGSLWIWLVNVTSYQFLIAYLKKESYLGQLASVGAAIGLPILLSLVLFYSGENDGKKIEVVAIQHGYEPHYEKDGVNRATQTQHMLNLAQQEISPQTAFVVLPEVALGYFQLNNLDNYSEIRAIRQFVDNNPQLSLLGGFGLFYDIEDKNAIDGAAVRERNGANGQKTYYEVYNAALQFESKKEEVALYRKSRLVPGPELFPFASVLGFLKPVVESFGGTTAGLGTEPIPKTFTHNGISVAPIICYESVYGEYIAEFTRLGANAIFIMTNDGWWDKTAGHKQHKLIAQLRAIESRRPVVRAASTGISAFINDKGFTFKQSKYGEAIALKGEIQLADNITFYMRWGNIIGRVSLFLGVILLLNVFVKGITRRGE